MQNETPGLLGIVGLVAALIGTFIVITVQSATIVPLIIGGAAVTVSLWAVQAVNKK